MTWAQRDAEDLLTRLNHWFSPRLLPIVVWGRPQKNSAGSFYPPGRVGGTLSHLHPLIVVYISPPALDVIRHEYAHFLCWLRGERQGHGDDFSRTLEEVGAVA